MAASRFAAVFRPPIVFRGASNGDCGALARQEGHGTKGICSVLAGLYIFFMSRHERIE